MGKAVFVSTNLMRGIPIRAQPEFVNARVFELSDAIQDDKSPIWTPAGNGSFVSFLKEYTESVEETTKPESAKFKAAEERYRAAKREASLQLELATYRYRDFVVHDQTLSFDAWLQSHGFDYLDSKEERDTAKANLRDVQASGGADVRRARELLMSAMNTAVGTTGDRKLNHNPLSTDRYMFSRAGTGLVIWSATGLGDKFLLTQVKIDLEHGFDGTWAELGFPSLDMVDMSTQRTSFTALTQAQQEQIRAVLRSWDMTLRFTALHSFDVSRGLWNIEGFRTILPDLGNSAPASLRAQVLKTSRLLLAYNPDLVLRLPKVTFRKLFPNEDSTTDAAQASSSKLQWPESVLLRDLFKVFPLPRLRMWLIRIHRSCMSEESGMSCIPRCWEF